ncbi:ABC-2 type transport system ATP-binding protein [Desulfitobacterium sp. LBE]|uniref:Nod factor export ATP-binding protein I n=2 Tax=root TaxID=1 RepID=A0A098B0R8_DESHA|nr:MULTISPECIES: ABC transporter ATP-binding protein [Desulfitobacterium]MEA5025535.1 ABC transporter ATP-binding protein [Desulfitobacterium hafniense]TWH56588.1 ABC-2 type transport system ATP-binding protein [Desulfitobacterium sp. LBE]CDX01466.1 Nod factor export ATP-binding protein I [Desulfitobacterium hafniense]
MNQVLIKTHQLTKRYGDVPVVNQLNLEVRAGEIFGFLGPNGAGKTTTIKILTGLMEPSEGEALICGYDIRKQPTQAKALMAYVPDQPKLYGKLSAWEFLKLIGDLYQIPKDVSRKRAEMLMEMFGLLDRADELLEGYSHGMRQKVVLASALIHQPKVILLDEPTVGLDPASARLLKDVLQELAHQGAAVFVSTHILEIAERMCHRVGILQKGKLIAQGSPEELRQNVGHGGESLEDIFLELTGGHENEELIKSLEEGRA